ncbi:MAG: hypothetical protein ACE5J7_03045 [Candidatus Aenigmatarchaeota archaeon]
MTTPYGKTIKGRIEDHTEEEIKIDFDEEEKKPVKKRKKRKLKRMDTPPFLPEIIEAGYEINEIMPNRNIFFGYLTLEVPKTEKYYEKDGEPVLFDSNGEEENYYGFSEKEVKETRQDFNLKRSAEEYIRKVISKKLEPILEIVENIYKDTKPVRYFFTKIDDISFNIYSCRRDTDYSFSEFSPVSHVTVQGADFLTIDFRYTLEETEKIKKGTKDHYLERSFTDKLLGREPEKRVLDYYHVYDRPELYVKFNARSIANNRKNALIKTLKKAGFKVHR